MRNVSLLIKPASSGCNMRCKYCFYADEANIRSGKFYGNMTEAVLESLVKRAFDSATGFVTFSFQGGEPTLVGLDFYKKLIELQKKYNARGVQVSNAIQTNGYIIDDEWASFLAKNDFLVGLSMDGTAEMHDKFRLDCAKKPTFERVRRTADLFEKYGVRFNVLCVVTEQTARNPRVVYDALKKYGYIQFIACLDGLEGGKSDYSLTPSSYAKFLIETFNGYYLDFLSAKPVSVRNFDNYVMMLLGGQPENCAMRGVCTPTLVVEGDGSVYPCDFYVLDEWKLGNVAENSLEEMLGSPTAIRFVEQSVNRSQECRACKYFALCRGGCKRESSPLMDGQPVKTEYCTAYYEFFEACYDGLVDIARKVRELRGAK